MKSLFLASLFLALCLIGTVHGGAMTFTNAASYPIADLGSATSTIVTSGVPFSSIPSTLTDTLLVQINLNIAHTWPGDLIITVCDPYNFCATVGTRAGLNCAPYYVNRQVNDNNAGFKIGNSFTCSSLPVAMSPQDTSGFQYVYRYDSPNGNWVMTATDNAAGDSGTLVQWSVVFLSGCFGNPCVHGTCTATGWDQNQFSCACTAGWTGTTCDTDVNECLSSSACGGNTQCTNTVGSYACACLTGYTGNPAPGSSCTDINECLGANNCAPGGVSTCTNTAGSYTCACKTGYTGNGIACANCNECLNGACGTNNCAVAATCSDTLGSFTCTCKTGYTGTGTTCSDCDECSGQCGGNLCATGGISTCTNTAGSYTCACKTGYTGNGITCNDCNECLKGACGVSTCAGGNSSICANNPGSYTCACKPGFYGDGQTCTDYNECAGQNGGNNCAAGISTCTNTPGGFTCACVSGYTGNGVTCTDINECLANPCNATVSTCQNSPGSYSCVCKPGATGSNCSDFNECANSTTNDCSPHAICTNTFLSYYCNCSTGYNGDGIVCTNINECSSQSLNNCSANAVCTDNPGSYSCVCLPGFFGSGTVCTDYNECLGQGAGNNCSTHGTCGNTPGSFNCSCNKGFFGDGVNCTDYNECAGQGGGNNCNAAATCSNTVGSFVCACNAGYSGNGTSCTDYNECAGEGGGNNCAVGSSTCTNLPGTFSCACNSGYHGNGIICTDWNECAGDNGGNTCNSNAACLNIPGSYTCTCNPGYAGDGVSCIFAALPEIALTTSTSISLNWTQTSGASAYSLKIQNSVATVVFNGSLGITSTYLDSPLPSFSVYTFTLTTWAQGNLYSASQSIQAQTRPAALTSTLLTAITFNSVEFSFTPSLGASTYSYALFNSTGTELTQGYLSTQVSGPLYIGGIIGLQANTNYLITIYAGDETVGYSFSVVSAPLPAQGLIGRRHNDTSVVLDWTPSPGVTQYYLTLAYPNGTSVSNWTFGIASQFVVPNLISNVTYTFTVYSGGVNGTDYSHGSSVDASTLTLFCNVTTEANATWALTAFNQLVYGICLPGFGGKPSRICLDSGGGSDGTFSQISGVCTKVPDSLPHPPVADPYDATCNLSWKPQSNCIYFRVVAVGPSAEAPVNNGEGGFLVVSNIVIRNLSPLTNYTVKVYCGNPGGFESVGRELSFETNIPTPSHMAIGLLGDTSVTVNWGSDSYAQWHRVEYTEISGSRRGAATVFAARQTGRSVAITGLTPGANYSIHIYSGRDSSYYEPHGSVITVKTLTTNGDQNNGGLGLGAIIGIVVGGLAGFLLIAIIAVVFVVRQNRRTKQLASILTNDMTMNSVIEKPSLIAGKASYRASSIAPTSESTLLNTTMEISVPGFLLLDPGRQYRIEGPLGRGGAATVFKGILLDQELVNQHGTYDIALKNVERNPKISLEENKDRFLQEVSIMWSCTFHQNVVKLVGYSLEPTLCIITKLYPIDLFTLIHHPDEYISPLLGLKLAGDISSAMAHMQDMGIIHRDLKSSNVLLESVPINPTQSVLRAVVCDFGLARITSTAKTIEGQKFNDIGGFSPRYASPEVFASCAMLMMNDPEVDKKSDVYSFSIITWELLTAKVPWEGLKRDEIERNVRGGNRPPVPVDDGSDPAKTILIEIMRACWHDNPGNRPSFDQITSKISSIL